MLDKLKSRLIGNVVGVVVVLGAFPVRSKSVTGWSDGTEHQSAPPKE